MSGHSKWSKVKHQKAVTDAVKSSQFTKASRGIQIAVKEGGGITDPEKNFKLRLAIEKARSVNMPKENIERAILKAKGEETGDIIQARYEAIGPGNTAIIIQTATDNSNRTISQIKNTLERFGGTLVAQGAVIHLFTSSGLIVIPKANLKYDTIFELVINYGADDIKEVDEYYEIYMKTENMHNLKNVIEQNKIPIEHNELTMKPLVSCPISEENSTKLDILLDNLNELDDVQTVFSNEQRGE